MAVLLDAQEALFLGAELLNADIPRLNTVLSLPLATAPYDAASQCHLVGGQREKRAAAAMIALIRHHRPEPGIGTVRMLNIGRVGTFARGIEGEDCAHGVEQRGFARAIGTNDRDDRLVEGQHYPLPVIPVHEFQGHETKHSAGLLARLLRYIRYIRCRDRRGLIESRRQQPRQRPLDDAWRQRAVIDQHIQQGPFGDLAASLMDEAASFERAEVAVEADLAAEEMAEI